MDAETCELPSLPMQRRSQDSCLGGGGTRPMPPATFSVISGSRPDSVGGVATVFRVPRERTTFSGGGGVVAEIFPVTTGRDQSNSLNSGTFLSISETPQRNNIN